MRRPLFSIVIIFYDEAENVVSVVSSLQERLESSNLDFQLILVNNGSRDNTGGLIKNFAEKDERVKMVIVSENQGYGWGIIRGLQEVDGEIIGYMGGDGQVRAEDVIKIAKEILTEDYDIVKARRAKREDGIIRKIISKLYVVLFSTMFGIPFYDINASPIVFKRELLRKLQLQSKDWFLDAEIMIKAKYLKLQIKEVPITFQNRKKGKSSVGFATVIEFLKNMLYYKFGGEIKKWKEKNLLK